MSVLSEGQRQRADLRPQTIASPVAARATLDPIAMATRGCRETTVIAELWQRVLVSLTLTRPHRSVSTGPRLPAASAAPSQPAQALQIAPGEASPLHSSGSGRAEGTEWQSGRPSAAADDSCVAL